MKIYMCDNGCYNVIMKAGRWELQINNSNKDLLLWILVTELYFTLL